MTQPFFLQMRVDPPDLIRSLINTYTQNLEKQNQLFASDLVEIELTLARHSQKLNIIQQMKNDKRLKQNILLELQFKELAKKFPNILADQKQKHSIQKQKFGQETHQNKSFHLRTLKKNSQPKSLFKEKNIGSNNQNKSKQKQKFIQPNKNSQIYSIEKENNCLLIKSPYFRKQIAKNNLKQTKKNQNNKISRSKNVRKSSAQLIFAQNTQTILEKKLQSPRRNMQKIRLSNQGNKKNQYLIVNLNKEQDKSIITNPYHHSKFKKQLDNFKLAYDEAPSSNRGKIIQLRESFNRTIK